MIDIVLSPRESKVAALLLEGCGNKEIAARLHMPERTVKAHFKRLFSRFGISKGGIQRVKLATALYKKNLCHHLQQNAS